MTTNNAAVKAIPARRRTQVPHLQIRQQAADRLHDSSRHIKALGIPERESTYWLAEAGHVLHHSQHWEANLGKPMNPDVTPLLCERAKLLSNDVQAAESHGADIPDSLTHAPQMAPSISLGVVLAQGGAPASTATMPLPS